MTPRAVSTLVLWQWMTVFLGVLFTGILLRVYYANSPRVPLYPDLVRHHGFWLCLLPPAWAAASIRSVGTLDALPELDRRYTVAGYVLWAVLALVLAPALWIVYHPPFYNY